MSGDLLHQVIKGTFKDHLVTWVGEYLCLKHGDTRGKEIIDEIDRVLAEHYGFTDEELDFILNYDIKYRMGRESDDA